MRYLLDTNILVNTLTKESFEDFFNKTYRTGSQELLVSVVAEGEIRSISLQRNWGIRRIQQMQTLLDGLILLPIKTHSIIRAYARIDAYSQGKLVSRPLPPGLSARNMGKNDLWIAATAHAADATLVTTDQDFDHLNGTFLDLDWVDVTKFI